MAVIKQRQNIVQRQNPLETFLQKCRILNLPKKWGMKTQLILNDMKFYAYHGAFKEETVIGGQYSVSIVLDADLSKAAETDKLEDTIDLQEVYNLVRKEMQLPSKLIEHAAYRIVKAIKQQFCQIENVKVTLRKLNPPIGGQIEDEAIVISE
jgi:7,8-dihydroneopterin aldolase/epimerase/oxygenase